MTEHLRPLDTMFLNLEQAEDGATMHFGAVMVSDPLPEGGAPDIDRVLAHLERRLHEVPRHRMQLSRPRARHLSWAEWAPAPRFDIAARVGDATLPDRPRRRRDPEELVAAPECSLNGALSTTRAYGSVRFALDDLKTIDRALGGTVNDVVLSISAVASGGCCSSAARRLRSRTASSGPGRHPHQRRRARAGQCP